MQVEKVNWDFFEDRKTDRSIKHLIIHGFAFPVNRIIEIWKDFKVSPHYLIDENGKIMQFVSENKVAYHAGKSFWNGESALNFSSIGIELYSPNFGQEPYPEKQMDALKELVLDIIKRYSVFPENIIGHSDVAPTRKVDPGRAFPWRELAKENIGLWPKESTSEVLKDKKTPELLSMIGYDISDEKAAFLAFLRHFMPEKVSYEEDVIHMEDTLSDRIKNCTEPDDEIKSFLAKVAYTYQAKRSVK